MSARLASNAYGKAAIRLVKLVREESRHRIHDCTVQVRLEGRFESAHTAGINADVLPTDTMKNTVFALAKDATLDEPERFAHLVCRHFLDTAAAIASSSSGELDIRLRRSWSSSWGPRPLAHTM